MGIPTQFGQMAGGSALIDNGKIPAIPSVIGANVIACHFCGAEIKGSEDMAGLVVAVNGDLPLPPKEHFVVLFGIWDQREHKQMWICGACLCDRLRAVCMP